MFQALRSGLPLPQAQGFSSWLRGFATAAAASSKQTGSLAMIKDLREKSGAPISDVKSCLVQANWQLEDAYELLRKKGLAAAAKKASRHASEGLVAVASMPGAAAVVEINSETDFVSRNQLFTDLMSAVSAAVLQLPKDAVNDKFEVDINALEKVEVSGQNCTVGALCSSVAAQVRENIKLRRAYLVTSPGVLGTYVHNSVAPGLGRIVGIVALQQLDTQQQLPPEAREVATAFANDVAMHAVGYNALYLDPSSVPQEVMDKERQILSAQAAATGKQAKFLDKIVDGRITKWYEDVCLSHQRFMLDDKITVSTAVKQLSDKLKLQPGLQLQTLLRVRVGEGLQEAAQTDFAAEVASMAGTA